MNVHRTVLLSLGLVASLVVTAIAQRAEACGEAMFLAPQPERPTPAQEISRAEKAVEAGRYTAATQNVLRTFPQIRNAKAGADPLESRALRVLSLAIVRSDGRAGAAGGATATATAMKKAKAEAPLAWTKDANLSWAVQALRELAEQRANEPSILADLGEALAKTPAGHPEALGILEPLARKDLMGSSHAYAALATLRAEKGDATGAEAAITRCEAISKTDAVCRPSAAGAPSAKPVVPTKA